jgi:excisionase family DNA binding protein
VNVTTPNHPGSRFLTLSDVAEILNISASQARALVLRQDLRAVKLGGRGVWRVERSALESYIERLYQETEQFLSEHPLAEDEVTDDAAPDE